jgi:hypothetical protein
MIIRSLYPTRDCCSLEGILMLIMPLVMYSVNVCGRELVNFSAFTGQSNVPIIWGKASFVMVEDTRHRNKCLNSNPYAQHNVCDIT